MTAAKSWDLFRTRFRARSHRNHEQVILIHLSPCSEVSQRVARLGGRLDLSQLDISRGFTAFSSGSSWRLVTISCEPVTKYDESLESSCEERKAHRLRYFARRFSLLEANCQMVVTSSTRSAKHVTK
jgi:hypothetical protein